MADTTFAPSSPVAVVEDARALVAGLGETLWAARTPVDLLAVVTGIEKLRSTMDAVELAVIAEVEATDAAKVDGWASTKDFVTAVAGGHQGAGSAAVTLARAVASDRARTGQALAAGAISRAQAQVIVRTIDELPTRAGLRAAAEEAMLEAAATRNATELAHAGRYLVARLDPDGDERKTERQLRREERAAHHHRHLSITDDGAGGVRIKGRTTTEDAAIIKAALFPLAAPEPTTPGSCGGHTGSGGAGGAGGAGGVGVKPCACGDPDCAAGPSGTSSSGGCAGGPGCAHDGRDPREHGARFLDAFVEACRRLTRTDQLPQSHGTRPRLNLTIDYTSLRDSVGTGTAETGESLSPAAVRRLACDADLIPMVLGSNSEILDVGRAHRLVTATIWTALLVRDRHCTFPGCTRPPIACDAHHLTHWLDGGRTSLDNLALLCRTHHTTIHNTPWQIRLNPIDKKPEFLPPTTLDPQRKPLRHRQPRE